MNPIWSLIKVEFFGLFCGIWQGGTAGSRKITGGAFQLTTAAAITGKDNVGDSRDFKRRKF